MYIVEENVPKSQMLTRETYWWNKLKARFGYCAIEAYERKLTTRRKYRENNRDRFREWGMRYRKNSNYLDNVNYQYRIINPAGVY